MIRIKNLKVQNFKSLINTEIEEFGPVNMFYGFNNCGKSNIFRFLKLLFERKRLGTKVQYLPSDGNLSSQSNTLFKTTNFWNGNIWNEPFLFTGNKRNVPITFKISLVVSPDYFYFKDLLIQKNILKVNSEADLVLEGRIVSLDFETSEFRINQVILNGSIVYLFDDEIENFFPKFEDADLTEKVGESILGSLDDLVLLIDSNRGFTKEKSEGNSGNFDIGNFKSDLYELYINADKHQDFLNLVEFIQKFDFSEDAKQKLGSNLKSYPFRSKTEMSFAKFESELEIMLINEFGRFPLQGYGTGIQQFLFILSRIALNKSKIVIVEELESNLSPLYQTELLRFLKSGIGIFYDQLIFSSHSPFFTQKNHGMVDIIHHVRIGHILNGGTSVECHDDVKYDENTGDSYFSLLYS